MIVRKEKDDVILIKQHQHGLVSGEMAELWGDEQFKKDNQKNEVVYAVKNHDRAWKDLDDRMLLETGDRIPASFVNYPQKYKQQAYRKELAKLERSVPYAALLVSKHFASFFAGRLDKISQQFLREEKGRQERVKELLNLTEQDEKHLNNHFQILQFCDHMSLFLCMNKPGAHKQEEILWFRDGFSQRFPYLGNQLIAAQWLDEKKVSITPFPFSTSMVVRVPYKRVPRTTFLKADWQQHVKQHKYEHLSVNIINGEGKQNSLN
ncbi:DUF3891 family protein [Texcoconibacillus texcoconensis]|uniref:Uncharacterized protein n=1 Tax=Texcoconibacillus texcoconensis TaxID=1095777 RepID=A0A840QT69_9BACI|nr:DUF3891 family protein [Texcoconibacillus texcoconensis]MBB5174499.1 hypothetical protein [Texcoconibacillus texcoconensis]